MEKAEIKIRPLRYKIIEAYGMSLWITKENKVSIIIDELNKYYIKIRRKDSVKERHEIFSFEGKYNELKAVEETGDPGAFHDVVICDTILSMKTMWEYYKKCSEEDPEDPIFCHLIEGTDGQIQTYERFMLDEFVDYLINKETENMWSKIIEKIKKWVDKENLGMEVAYTEYEVESFVMKGIGNYVRKSKIDNMIKVIEKKDGAYVLENGKTVCESKKGYCLDGEVCETVYEDEINRNGDSFKVVGFCKKSQIKKYEDYAEIWWRNS